MFGWAAKWKRKPPDRLTRLANAIEAIDERDRRLIDETARVDHWRAQGAVEMHDICRAFVDSVNARLKKPAILLDPAVFAADHYSDGGPNLFQINLRGRLLQVEFGAVDDLYGTEDFRRPYVLQGSIRSFNQDLLSHHVVDEQTIFYCPEGDRAHWYFFDARTYRAGRITEDYLVAEMERLL